MGPWEDSVDARGQSQVIYGGLECKHQEIDVRVVFGVGRLCQWFGETVGQCVADGGGGLSSPGIRFGTCCSQQQYRDPESQLPHTASQPSSGT